MPLGIAPELLANRKLTPQPSFAYFCGVCFPKKRDAESNAQALGLATQNRIGGCRKNRGQLIFGQAAKGVLRRRLSEPCLLADFAPRAARVAQSGYSGGIHDDARPSEALC